MGRPTKYSKEFDEQARKMCLLGATDPDLANFFGVAVSTISKWKVEHKGFSDAIKEGKDKADSQVAERLFNRAMGYSHDSEEIKIVGNQVVRVPVIKQYPPDTAAAIFWLKNRQKDKWREKTEIVGKDDGPIEINNYHSLPQHIIDLIKK